MPLVGANFFVIPGWSAGPGPEPMNTGDSQVGKACVLGFRALGRSLSSGRAKRGPGGPSPGMTYISHFLTALRGHDEGEVGYQALGSYHYESQSSVSSYSPVSS
jgi:hypothetical protein